MSHRPVAAALLLSPTLLAQSADPAEASAPKAGSFEASVSALQQDFEARLAALEQQVAEQKTAREAAEKALAFDRQNADVHVILGRIQFSRYVAEPDAAAKEALWKTTYAAFEKAMSLLGTPAEFPRQSLLAEVHVQLANLHGWKQDLSAASASFASAVSWDPSRVNFPQAYNLLGSTGFLGMCEDGSKRFAARAGENDARNATVAWWTGFAQFENAKWPECEASSGSMPALVQASISRRSVALGTAVTSRVVSLSVRSSVRNVTMTSSMFHWGSWPSTSNLMISSTLDSSSAGSLSVRNAAVPVSTAIAIASSGTLSSVAAAFSVATSSPSGSAPPVGNSPLL